MKRYTLILFILLSMVGYSQDNIQREKVKATNTLYADLYFIWRGDTIDFNSFVNQTSISQLTITAESELITDSILKVNGYEFYPSNVTAGQILQYVGGQFVNVDFPGGYDSLVFDITTGYLMDYRAGSVFDSTYFDGRYAVLSDIESKVVSDTLIIGGDTIVGFSGGNIAVADSTLYVTPYYLEDYLAGVGVEKDVYTVTLPYAGDVNTRATNATYLPPGWSVSIGSNPEDLKITHNLDRGVMDAKVWSINGTVETLVTGNTAYSGVKTEDSNTLLLLGFVPTLPYAVHVRILFSD